MRLSVIMSAAMAAMIALGAMLISAEARADEVNMATVTCDDLEDEDEAVLMLVWLDGYLSHREQDTVWSDRWIGEMADVLEQACERGDTRPLLQIITTYVDQ